VALVAIERILFAAAQSVVAGLVVLPLVRAVPVTPVDLEVTRPLLLVAVVVLAALLSGSLGLALGTTVAPRQIGLMFSVVVLPLTFLGAVYYPWTALAPVRWLQIAVLANPLVYVSEGLRGALTPSVETMAPVAYLGAMAVSVVVLATIGVRGFVRRTTG
jgi:ABC-2 type transport system permease protein